MNNYKFTNDKEFMNDKKYIKKLKLSRNEIKMGGERRSLIRE
jgi:hypothetical protein